MTLAARRRHHFPRTSLGRLSLHARHLSRLAARRAPDGIDHVARFAQLVEANRLPWPRVFLGQPRAN